MHSSNTDVGLGLAGGVVCLFFNVHHILGGEMINISGM